MRRIGTLTDPDDAKRFADYLFTLSIECSVDIETISSGSGSGAADSQGSGSEPATSGSQSDRASGSGETRCDLWVRDESHVDRAKQELEAFLQSPGDEKYRVHGEADRIRKQQVAEEKRKKKLQQKVNHKTPHAGGGMLGGVSIRQQSIPVIIGVVVLSVIASFATGFGRPQPSVIPGELSTEETVFYAMSFVDWRDYQVDSDPYASIKKGEVWRLITPLFLHGSTFHLAFNMLGLFFLGSAIERLQGSFFMAFLFLACGVFGTIFNVSLPPEESLPPMLAGLAGSPFLIGASGAVFGLFGYMWIRPLLSPSYPVRMMSSNVTIMLMAMVFMVFFVDGIANGAHIGGLISGVVIAAVASRLNIDSFS